MSAPVIAGIGAQTAVGLNLPANVAAIRAGLNCFELSDYLLSFKNGEPLRVSQLGTLVKDAPPFERMKAMALSAAREAIEPWLQSYPQGESPSLPVLLAVPSDRPGIPKDQGKRLIEWIIAELSIKADKPHCWLAITGHEGGLAALGYATNLIRAGVVPAVLLGGVDCYLEIQSLHWLEAQNRLKVETQPNGMIPGEGAAFVLLCSRDEAHRASLPVFAEVLTVGRAMEPHPWYSEKPTIGEGLTQAFQTVFRDGHCPEQQVRVTYCDLNGESWRAEEWGYSYVRTGARHQSPLDVRHPATNWGDVGAASGPLLLALACFELVRYFENRHLALVWSASDLQPYRSACVLCGVQG